MNFFKNKYVIAIIVIALVLALLTYLLMDSSVKERPQAAIDNQSYPLVAKPNCRYSSGECELHNLSFDAKLTVNLEEKRIYLTASAPLKNAMMGFVDQNGTEVAPTQMLPKGDDNKQWFMEMSVEAGENSIVRVVLQANNALYFADTSLQFASYQAAVDESSRKNQ